MNNFWQRSLTGAIFVAVIVGAVMWGAYSFLLLLYVIQALGLVEYSSLFKGTGYRPSSQVMFLCGSAIFAIGTSFILGYGSMHLLPAIFPLLIIPFVYELYNRSGRVFQRAANATAGMVYISFAILSFTAFAFHGEGNVYNPYSAITYFILIWSSDTFAYLSGRAFGRHKLFPSVSPKKTWEGSIGGALCTAALAVGLHYLWGEHITYSLPVWVGLALIIVVFGTWGDLVESLLKRSLGVKDSGNILPGHGGALDRFDSLLFSAPFVWSYIHFFG